jgi:hypothetical protein
VIIDIVETKTKLDMFDEARDDLKEAIEIRCCIFGEESVAVAGRSFQ